VCWTWPSIDLTLCYDLTEEAWHQRADVAETSPGSGLYNTPHRWRARGSCGFATTAASGGLPVILVGQVDTAFLCELRLDTSTDEHPTAPPVPIFRLRIAPYVSAENQWLFLQQVELGIQAVADFGGQPPPQLYVGQAGGSDLASLYPPMDAAVGLAVNGLAVAQWFQLGRHRTDHLLLAISQNNTLPCVWGPGLWLRATPGTGQL
jgi:hypothetical protein